MVLDQTTPEDINKKYLELKNNLLTPETRNFKIAVIKASNFNNNISFDPEEIREDYESRLDEYIYPEKRRVYQIILENESDEKIFKKEIKQYLTSKKQIKLDEFLKLIHKLFNISKEDADLGYVLKGNLEEIFEKQVFNANLNELSDSIKTSFGWRFFLVSEIIEKKEIPFEEVRDSLIEEHTLNKALDDVYNNSNLLYDLILSGSTLEEAARETGADLEEFKTLGINDFHLIHDKINYIKDTDSLIKTVFNIKEGEYSDIIETEKDNIYIIRLDKINTPRVKTKEEAKGEIIKLIEEEKRKSKIETKAREFLKLVKKNNNLESFKEFNGRDLLLTDWVTKDRRMNSDNLDVEITNSIFETPLGEISNLVNYNKVSFALIIPTEEKELISDDINSINKNSINEEIRIQLGEDLLSAILYDLKKEHQTKINYKILDSILSTD